MKLRAHEFAVYVPQQPIAQQLIAQQPIAQQIVCINDSNIIHRITHVLRLSVGDKIILFDENSHSLVTIGKITRKSLEVFVEQVLENKRYEPKLFVQLALLKRDALQEAVALLTTLGVTEIELFTSEKVQRIWGGQDEYDRLYRCMIAAAEQSKCFALPKLNKPVSLEQILKKESFEYFVCDAHGTCLIQNIVHAVQKNKDIKLLIGPEGDFTESEINIITKNAYQSWRLTKTILRSEQAAYLATGIIRSSS